MSSPSDRNSAAASHSPGEVLALIGSGAVTTRADIARVTRMARSTVSQRVDALIAHGLVDEDADGGSTGGRPPRRLALRTREHAVAGVDLGASHCRVALMDIGGTTLATHEEPLSIGDGPDSVLRHVERTLRALLEETHREPGTLRCIGVGVPGPVEFSTGRPVDPPIMPGWHRYPIPEFFASRFGVRALVDNDVNVMALGEQRRAFPDCRYLLYIKVGTGIGCGIVADGELHRGRRGARATSATSGSPISTIRADAAMRAAWRRSRVARHWRRSWSLWGWTRHRAAMWCGWCSPGTGTRCGWCGRPGGRSARYWRGW